MKGYSVDIISQGQTLPQMEVSSFFHSPTLFRISEEVKGSTPFMAVAKDASGRIVAHCLATLQRRGSWLPPYLYTIGRIYGEGDYDESLSNEQRDEIFGLMLTALTQKLKYRMCLYIEVSDLSQKMLGYRHFRENGFFPVAWQEVHNSLHSLSPEQRLSDGVRRRIKHGYDAGIETRPVRDEAEVKEFYKMLHGFYRMKLRRIIPPEKQFQEMEKADDATILITRYHNKIIGGSACVFSEGNAYLWYLASRRKSFAPLHPNTMTVWYALRYAYEHNYAHMFFMDVGLPWWKNPFREFILSFGGKPVGMYRWFRFTFSPINKILSWIERE